MGPTADGLHLFSRPPYEAQCREDSSIAYAYYSVIVQLCNVRDTCKERNVPCRTYSSNPVSLVAANQVSLCKTDQIGHYREPFIPSLGLLTTGTTMRNETSRLAPSSTTTRSPKATEIPGHTSVGHESGKARRSQYHVGDRSPKDGQKEHTRSPCCKGLTCDWPSRVLT